MAVRQWLNAAWLFLMSALVGLLLFGFSGAALEYSRSWIQTALGWLLLAAALACLGYGTLSFRCRVVSDGQSVRVVGRLRTFRTSWLEVQGVEACRNKVYWAQAQLVLTNGRRVSLPGIVETEIDDFIPWQSFERCIEQLQEARDEAWCEAGLDVAPRPFMAWRWSRYGWALYEATTAPGLVLIGNKPVPLHHGEVLRTERVEGRRCTVVQLRYRRGAGEPLAVELPRAVRDLQRACQPAHTQQPETT